MLTRATGNADHSTLHERGVMLVAHRLRENGFHLESLAYDQAYDPQIVAQRRGRRYHFAVRTSMWPGTARLECSELRGELREWAARHAAACFLVQVSLRAGAQDSALCLRFSRI